MNKSLKIGEIAEYEGKKYKVIKAISKVACIGCSFYIPFDDCKMYGLDYCGALSREDNESIIYVEVNL